MCNALRPVGRTAAWTTLQVACALLLLSAAAAETTKSDGLLGKGASWETPFFVQTSDQPGPTVVITGGVHGNEPAGAAAAEQIRHWPIRRGKLVVLPRANPPALAARSRNIPNAAKELANLNRNFPKAKDPGPAAGDQAQAIWTWVQALQPTWFLDLHEGFGMRGAGSTSVGASLIVPPSRKTRAAAERMLAAVNATIDDPLKKFVRLGSPIDGSLARAAGEHLSARAMIVETSVNDLPPPVKASGKNATKPDAADADVKPTQQPLSRRVRQHRIMVGALLTSLGMLAPDFDVDLLPGKTAAPEQTHVALYDASGTGGQDETTLEKLLARGGMRVTHCGPDEIVAGALDRFHLVVFPGGSGSKEGAAIGGEGREQVRRFVEQGGGYLGICAGAYLCTSGYDWSLNILGAKTVSPQWKRGRATLKIELTEQGRKLLGDHSGLLDVRYHNGPVVVPAHVDGLPDYEPLALFRTEIAEHGAPAGVMINAPAIAAGRCGRGRVVFISPHPEQTPGLEDLVRRAATWASGQP